MANYIDHYTDKQVKALEKQVAAVYAQAAREIRKKLQDFEQAHKIIEQKMLRDVRDGVITEKDYKDWLRNQAFTGERWKKKLDEVTKIYQEADKKARELVGQTDKSVFTEAANRQAYETEQAVGGVSFTLYDSKAVDRIIKNNPQVLPKWKINEPKDYVWNEKRVQNAVMQGIIQGESIGKIGNRLCGELATSNANKMMTFARTAVTGAQNAGTLERMREAKGMGIKVKKKWLSVHDSRVRDAHADLDGEVVDIDEPFHSMLGDIMCPGDPAADPGNTYNCRCTMIYVYPDYEEQKSRESYKEWLEDKETDEEQTDEMYDDSNDSSEEYQYHATKQSSLIGIAEDGLRPSDGHVGRGVYFANSPDDAIEWTSETSTGGKAILRVAERYLKNGELERYLAEETGYNIAENVFDGTVPLEYIQIKVNDNGDDDDWWSLAQYFKNNRRKYAMLNKKTQRKIDKIVDEEFERKYGKV